MRSSNLSARSSQRPVSTIPRTSAPQSACSFCGCAEAARPYPANPHQHQTFSVSVGISGARVSPGFLARQMLVVPGRYPWPSLARFCWPQEGRDSDECTSPAWPLCLLFVKPAEALQYNQVRMHRSRFSKTPTVVEQKGPEALEVIEVILEDMLINE